MSEVDGCCCFEHQMDQLGSNKSLTVKLPHWIAWVTSCCHNEIYHGDGTTGDWCWATGNFPFAYFFIQYESVNITWGITRPKVHLSPQLTLNKPTEVSHTGKELTILPLLYLSTWFPQLVFGLRRGEERKCLSKMHFSSQPQLTMPVKHVRGNRKEPVTIVLFLRWSASWQLQTKPLCFLVPTRQSK